LVAGASFLRLRGKRAGRGRRERNLAKARQRKRFSGGSSSLEALPAMMNGARKNVDFRAQKTEERPQ